MSGITHPFNFWGKEEIPRISPVSWDPEDSRNIYYVLEISP